MNYPIVSVVTKDGLELFGYYTPGTNKTCFINIHGTGSSFYVEGYEPVFIEALASKGYGVLFTNNRGSYLAESWQRSGAALEKFEDSVLDIDAWIAFAITQGYEKIILQGHSFGTEKVVYYMNHGGHKDKVIGVILLGFADSVGTEQKNVGKYFDALMQEAQQKQNEGKEWEFLTTHWNANADEMPISAATFLNFFSPNSELSKTLPFRNNDALPMVATIQVPILAIIGDQAEYTVIPIDDAIALLNKNNPRVTAHKIIGANHTFSKHRKELVEKVINWIVTTHV